MRIIKHDKDRHEEEGSEDERERDREREREHKKTTSIIRESALSDQPWRATVSEFTATRAVSRSAIRRSTASVPAVLSVCDEETTAEHRTASEEVEVVSLKLAVAESS